MWIHVRLLAAGSMGSVARMNILGFGLWMRGYDLYYNIYIYILYIGMISFVEGSVQVAVLVRDGEHVTRKYRLLK